MHPRACCGCVDYLPVGNFLGGRGVNFVVCYSPEEDG